MKPTKMRFVVPQFVAGALVVGAMALGVAGCSSGSTSSSAHTASPPPAPPGVHTGQDDMYLMMTQMNAEQTHTMAEQAQSRATNPEVKALAADMSGTSKSDIESISRSLSAWNISHASMDMGPDSYFITKQQIALLAAANGNAFDKLWLQSQSRLNANNIELAHAELQYGQNVDAKAVAQKVIDMSTQQNVRIGQALAAKQ